MASVIRPSTPAWFPAQLRRPGGRRSDTTRPEQRLADRGTGETGDPSAPTAAARPAPVTFAAPASPAPLSPPAAQPHDRGTDDLPARPAAPEAQALPAGGTPLGESAAPRAADPAHPARTPLRIALVAESFLPQVDGVAHTVCRTADHLAASGHEVIIVAPGPGPREYAGFRVERVRAARLPRYRAVRVGLPQPFRLRRILRRFEPDVVHLASPVLLGASARRAAHRLGIPAVAVFQTDLAGFARRHRVPAPLGALIWAGLRRVHRRAEINLAPSTATVRQLDERGISGVQLWPHGVDTQLFNPARRSARLRARLAPDGEVLVGYVGRMSSDKRVELLTELADLPGVRLVLVGGGPEEPALRRALPGAAFLGVLRGGELAEAFASLDVFVHTGADETFCLTVQEALASGVPVVAPACGGPLDLVRHRVSGLLYPPDDTEALRRAVTTLAGSPELRQTMGAAGHRSVQSCTWQAVGDQLPGHYRTAMETAAAGNRRPRPRGARRRSARLWNRLVSTPRIRR
ncbi:glycosyltransferase family 4 protein [Allostreptomyces psammosilenae]|uniref:Phosphatidylinositol alpha 1,6-mannosyltransferase n=1 Tax=Allostreptomyces psammosilenae TaxID=1892865 RepID=A0A852ZT02_9ACTN|nr:glycosyltransferase family 1 protein [Allostreptomyces psammosilenae]NYI04390.1 phosphatidylinositol alpha 1,6-mannosyltransferase [Allostreptomyces psammosilenae]